eukprot:GHVT01067617.1.p2 GENE.GHVT01067617.1~~GHVT01067617.1.p2  ORF type:complete len:148 (+),score=15.80 GHVT01067617.1:348-791(+)
MKHSPQKYRDRVGSFRNAGENLYSIWGVDKPPSPQRVAEAWYNEIYCYRFGVVGRPCTKYPNARCKKITGFSNNPLTGHFTQLMWSSASHVGCAVVECRSHSGGGKKFLAGCVYGSNTAGFGGNLLGETPFSPTIAGNLGLSPYKCT